MIPEHKIYLVFRKINDSAEDSVVGATTSRDLADGLIQELYEEWYQEEYEGMKDNPWADSGMQEPAKISIEEIHAYFKQFDRECRIETIMLRGEFIA